ncbi:hypothetical protein C2G38_2188928 [Gigaspora rosea]|uniref:F-box domain-containing protein n=1 Tax=Gigaspora rosea TaxID=44941 RepID=A0A397V587_9GLOM|nr:hypothetical protein C2G38_2188928 [Gigaspora rosea]
MASKIFMGDMPEILEKILNNLNNEFYSLYSCVLFSSLGEDEKLILKEECGINEISKTLSRFLKGLDLFLLEYQVKKWFNLELVDSESFYDDPIIQHLSLNEISDGNIEGAITLLRALAKHTTKINTMKINNFDPYYYETQLVHVLINVIKSQEQLSLFSFVGYEYPKEFHGIISALDNQKNSLQKVCVEHCAFNAEFDVLNNCKNLETFYIKVLPYEIIELIRLKTGLLLQRLSVEAMVIDYEIFCEESVLPEAIKSFCPNITYLSIKYFGFSTQLVELIGNVQRLQFLSLRCIVDEIPEEELKIRVMQFSKIILLTLQYLDLRNIWLEPYIDILFNHCQAPLKKLLIDRLDNEKNTKALIEFCARTGTLNYVGVHENSNLEALDDNIRKKVEANVALVPDHYIIINNKYVIYYYVQIFINKIK